MNDAMKQCQREMMEEMRSYIIIVFKKFENFSWKLGGIYILHYIPNNIYRNWFVIINKKYWTLKANVNSTLNPKSNRNELHDDFTEILDI